MEVTSMRCERVTLSDGTTAFAYSAGPLTDEDLEAVEGFNTILKCFDCLSREQCAMDGMCLVASGTSVRNDG